MQIPFPLEMICYMIYIYIATPRVFWQNQHAQSYIHRFLFETKGYVFLICFRDCYYYVWKLFQVIDKTYYKFVEFLS